ncbi:MAG: hypothetical protein GX248_08570 [Peptococcaceae bacterium]|jgi:hypothetical protein|nr:hypothetical protein [Peptococcaceae bacterium]
MFKNSEGKYGKYIIQDLHDPNLGSPEFQAMYKKFSKRVLWIDNNVVEGSIQMNTAWYVAVPEKDPVFEEHTHDFAELIGFYGSNPDDPYDLGAEIEIGINGEMHLLTRTSLIFIPSGMKHNPLRIKRVDRPVFHFSISLNPEYSGDGAYK